MAQKVDFLTEDVATHEAPSNEELESFHHDNANRCLEPDRFTFRHRYYDALRKRYEIVDS